VKYNIDKINAKKGGRSALARLIYIILYNPQESNSLTVVKHNIICAMAEQAIKLAKWVNVLLYFLKGSHNALDQGTTKPLVLHLI
jgi:hypothetical protein